MSLFACILFSGDSFDKSHNDSEMAFNSTIMESTSMKSHERLDRSTFEIAANMFQVQNTIRLKRDTFDWIGRTMADSTNWVTNVTKDATNWVTNTTEDAANWFAYVVWTDTIKWIGQAGNETCEWITQTAIDRDVWMFNATKNTGKWIDDVPMIETSKWTNGNIYHCIHKFILVQVVIGDDGDAVGGVVQGGPTGAAAKAVEQCVKSVFLKTKTVEIAENAHSQSNNTSQIEHSNGN